MVVESRSLQPHSDVGPTMTFAETMEKGVTAHRAGRFDEALACYRAALAIQPNDAEAASLCGLALVHAGEPEKALPLLVSAVKLEPGQLGFRVNLAEGFAQAGNADRALHELTAVLAADPKHARARHRFLALSSELLIARRDWSTLYSTATAWTLMQPQSPEAWRVAARAGFEQGRLGEATQSFARVLGLIQPTSDDLATYASLCLHALNVEDARKALDDATALDPDNATVLATRALLLMYLGHFEEAESCCRRSLARDASYAPAYTTLSRLRRGNLEDTDLKAVTEITVGPNTPLDYRISAAFAVAHARDARGETDAAFAGYEHAHALALERDRLEGRGYDAAQADKRAERILELTGGSWPEQAAAVSGTPRPIFIVGMPRSGTTLIESVLAAHSRVLACGERPTMQRILREYLALHEAQRSPDERTLQEWAKAYFAELPDLAAADHSTDKHPLNFEAAGLITRLFPHAVIVHVRRNPVETCLSLYRQEFNKLWTFAHRLADIGHHYGHYARLVAHWERALPGRFVTIQYEDFVTSFERAAPELVQACGLAWEPQCLQFQSTPRAIVTFSTVQAREPVKLGNGRAKRYERHLAPLVDALNRAGVDLTTGALASH